MTKKTDRTLLFHLTQSFFTTWALMKASSMEPGNILTFVFFLLAFFFYWHMNRRRELMQPFNRRSVAATAVLFTLLYMLVDYPHYIELLTSRLYRAAVLGIVFIGFVFLFYHLLLFLFSYTCNKDMLARTLPSEYLPASYIHPDHPRLSAAFTGIFRLFFGFFYRLGYALTGNMVTAVSVYTLFQMCLLAGSIAYFIATLRTCRIRPFILLLITAFYALIPYHAVFSVTIWKDIPFAAATLLFSCSVLRLSVRGSVNVINLFTFTISGVMICLFRSNGWYGFLLALPFLLFGFRKKAKTLYPMLFFTLLCAAVVRYPVMSAFQVEQPDFIESISIPIQQITSVICNDRALTAEETALIEQVVDLTYIRDLYNPGFADNIKELVRAGNQDYLVAHKKEFFRLWLHLGLRYPGDYLTAYVKQTYGYWYPDSLYLVAEGEGISATDLGVSHTPLIGGPLVVKGKEIAIKLGGMVPVYGTLWSMGVACWILLFSICTVLIRRETHKLVCYLPSVALLFTVLIATPVATEFRYVYFMVLSLSFYLITAMLPKESAPAVSNRSERPD